jgi:hypothetical protein
MWRRRRLGLGLGHRSWHQRERERGQRRRHAGHGHHRHRRRHGDRKRRRKRRRAHDRCRHHGRRRRRHGQRPAHERELPHRRRLRARRRLLPLCALRRRPARSSRVRRSIVPGDHVRGVGHPRSRAHLRAGQLPAAQGVVRWRQRHVRRGATRVRRAAGPADRGRVLHAGLHSEAGQVCVRFSSCAGDSCTFVSACLPDPGAAVVNCATAGDVLCGAFGPGFACHDEATGPYCCTGDAGVCANAG